jgi:hypothetical protein
MIYTLAGISGLIKTKLEGLKDNNDVAILGDVFDYPQGDFKKFPACVIMPKSSSGELIDTARNERTFRFEIDLYQENTDSGKTKSEAMDIMKRIVDRITESFDTDKDLGGEVEIIRAVGATFDFRVAAGTFQFAAITVDCLTVVPNY